MANLKSLRLRIKSVKNTRQITKTMKMVSAAKVRRARTAVENTRPYAEKLSGVLSRLASGAQTGGGSLLLTGRETESVVRFIVFGSDRGLCGALNSNVIRRALALAENWQKAGQAVQVIAVGRKIRDGLKKSGLVVESHTDVLKTVSYRFAEELATHTNADFEQQKCDRVVLIYPYCESMLNQKPLEKQLIPFAPDTNFAHHHASPEYEPNEEIILGQLLPLNLSTQIYTALLETAASEHAARMASMDSATRNAGEMIKKLSLTYNRTRQANITKELIEIISGAEAV